MYLEKEEYLTRPQKVMRARVSQVDRGPLSIKQAEALKVLVSEMERSAWVEELVASVLETSGADSLEKLLRVLALFGVGETVTERHKG